MPRFRYLAIAALIVLSVAVYATARVHLALLGHVNFWKVPPPPRPPDAVIGDAPWALSALPDCFRQRWEATGSAAYVRALLPSGARRIPPGTRLTYGSCTIFVRDSEVLVNRGSDRMRVPPMATLYRFGDALALLHLHGRSNELRIYDIVTNQ